jgi:hypothetical protein
VIQLPGRRQRYNAAAFSPDGRYLAAAGAGKRVSVWDLSAPTRPARTFGGEAGDFVAVGWIGPERVLAVSHYGVARLIDVGAGTVRERPDGRGWVSGVAWCGGGRVRVVGPELRFWEVVTDEVRHTRTVRGRTTRPSWAWPCPPTARGRPRPAGPGSSSEISTCERVNRMSALDRCVRASNRYTLITPSRPPVPPEESP